MRVFLGALAGLAIGLAPTGSQLTAQTLAEQQLTAREDAKLAGSLATTNAHCGTSLQASIAWPGFLTRRDKLPFATGDCEAALEGLYLMCNDPKAKQVVAQKLKSLQCVPAEGKQALSLDPSGAMTLSIDLDGANYSSFVQKWLGDHL